MPHRKARRPERERGNARCVPLSTATDLAPTIATQHEPIPKSVSRVLDAAQIRREFRKKKRQLDGVGNSDDDLERKKRRHDATDMKYGKTTALRINSSETVAQFSRRVENSMMPLIKAALRQSSAQERKVRSEEAAQESLKRGKQEDKVRRPPPASSKKGSDPPLMAAAGEDQHVDRRSGPKEFQAVSTSAPRRLNDVAQEPPTIKKHPRGALKGDAAASGVLSMAQKAMMEEEREKAIKHYRELKARKLRESGGAKHRG